MKKNPLKILYLFEPALFWSGNRLLALPLSHTIPVLFSKPVPAEASSVHRPWPLVGAERSRLHFLPANPVSHLQYRKPRMWKKHKNSYCSVLAKRNITVYQSAMIPHSNSVKTLKLIWCGEAMVPLSNLEYHIRPTHLQFKHFNYFLTIFCLLATLLPTLYLHKKDMNLISISWSFWLHDHHNQA